MKNLFFTTDRNGGAWGCSTTSISIAEFYVLPLMALLNLTQNSWRQLYLHNLPLTHVSLHRPGISLAFMPRLPALQGHKGVLMSWQAPCSTCPRTYCPCQLPEPAYLSDAAAGPGSSCPQPCLAMAPQSQTHILSCNHSLSHTLAMAMRYRNFPTCFLFKMMSFAHRIP